MSYRLETRAGGTGNLRPLGAVTVLVSAVIFLVACAPPPATTDTPEAGAAATTAEPDTPTAMAPDATGAASATASPAAERTVEAATIASFEACVAAGYPVMESYPRQCRGPDGEVHTEDIGNELELMDRIRIASPRPGARVTSPVTVVGQARGTWYFEASFPVRLVTPDGETLAVVPATAQGEWMTEDFVPFEAVLEIEPEFADYTGPASLILDRANPSGLEEHAASLEVPVEIGPAGGAPSP